MTDILEAKAVTTSNDPTGGAGAASLLRRWVSNGDGTYSPAVANKDAFLAPSSYTPGTAFYTNGFSSVTVWCTAAPSAAWTINASPDGVSFFAITAVGNAGGGMSATGSISSAGIYTIGIPGGAYVQLTGGTGGTFFIGAGN